MPGVHDGALPYSRHHTLVEWEPNVKSIATFPCQLDSPNRLTDFAVADPGFAVILHLSTNRA